MDVINFENAVDKALQSLLSNRLALLCGAGLSMAAPSSIPSAAQLANRAKEKYDATYCPAHPPLPDSIDDQARFFFEQGQLYTVYLKTFIDRNIFASRPNAGHISIADLMLVNGITTAVSTNVDTLIEYAGNMLFGKIGSGTSRENMLNLSNDQAPLLKIHGCWSDPTSTIWTTGQINVEPIMTRIAECREWLGIRLSNCDLLVVGYSTDWDYLNGVLENSLGSVNPSNVIVVDTCETAELEGKAPVLYSLGQKAEIAFFHVMCSGADLLKQLRVEFSKSFIRQILKSGKNAFRDLKGIEADAAWLEPVSNDPEMLWQIRRDLEGCCPNEPAKQRDPANESLVGMTILQLQARGAVLNGSYWELEGASIRVIRAANQALHDVEAIFSGEAAPAISPDVTVAVGAESYSLPMSVARGSGRGSIVRGAGGRWLSRVEAVEELNL